MQSNNSWLRVLGIVVLVLVVLGSVAFVAYRIGLNQGAGLALNDPRPPSPFGQDEQWFGSRMRFMDSRFMDGRGFHPMMRFGWHFFHPGMLLGLAALILFVYLLVRAFSNQPASSTQSRGRKSQKR